MRLADRSTSLKTQQVAGPCRAKVKLPAEPVVIIADFHDCCEVLQLPLPVQKQKTCYCCKSDYII